MRLALYSANCSVRKVVRDTSKATATWVGFSSRSALMSIEVKPYTALVGCPVAVEKFSTGKRIERSIGKRVPIEQEEGRHVSHTAIVGGRTAGVVAGVATGVVAGFDE